MVSRDPLRAAEKLRQRIVASAVKGPQAVFVGPRGQVDCCAADGERYKAMTERPELFRRVVGVFDASVTAEQLAAELREVAR